MQLKKKFERLTVQLLLSKPISQAKLRKRRDGGSSSDGFEQSERDGMSDARFEGYIDEVPGWRVFVGFLRQRGEGRRQARCDQRWGRDVELKGQRGEEARTGSK